MHPWYRGFTGTIEPKAGTYRPLKTLHTPPHPSTSLLSAGCLSVSTYVCLCACVPLHAGRDRGSYLVSGTFRRVDDVTVEVTELPVKKWTQVRA